MREKRIAAVEKLMAACARPAQIIREVCEKFSVSKRQVQNDIAEVYRRQAEEDQIPEVRGQRRARLRMSLTMIFQHALSRKDFKAALQSLDRLARLDCLWEAPPLQLTENGPSSRRMLTDLVAAMDQNDNAPN